MRNVRTILVVEDEPNIRFALTAQLQRIPNVEVLEARNVDQAQQIVEGLHASELALDLAVVDLRLPRKGQMDINGGFEVMNTIRRCFPKAPVIVVTVRADAQARSRAETEFGCKFFVKPWKQSELAEAAESCLYSPRPGDAVVAAVEPAEQ